MAGTPATASSGNRWFLLGLGLLLGSLIGFVMLLSRLPVDSSLGELSFKDLRAEVAAGDYEFYSVLESQTVNASNTVRQLEPLAQEILMAPATRVVPVGTQPASALPSQTPGYTEVPASASGQASFYLQAGRFRNFEQAQQARGSLLLLGLPTTVVERVDREGVPGYRVRVGPYFDNNAVSVARQRLQSNGIDYELIRSTR